MQETCIVVPRAKVAFDIGRCPQRAVFQQTVLISHGHLDHVGGLPFHVASRSVPAIIVAASLAMGAAHTSLLPRPLEATAVMLASL